jgi:hypothetical protein
MIIGVCINMVSDEIRQMLLEMFAGVPSLPVEVLSQNHPGDHFRCSWFPRGDFEFGLQATWQDVNNLIEISLTLREDGMRRNVMYFYADFHGMKYSCISEELSELNFNGSLEGVSHVPNEICAAISIASRYIGGSWRHAADSSF